MKKYPMTFKSMYQFIVRNKVFYGCKRSNKNITKN